MRRWTTYVERLLVYRMQLMVPSSASSTLGFVTQVASRGDRGRGSYSTSAPSDAGS
jgi:hypothetical protein